MLLAIDYGVKHFAFARFTLADGVKSVRVISFPKKDADSLIAGVRAFFDEHAHDVELVLGEQQSAANHKACELQHYVRMLAAERGVAYKSVAANCKYPPSSTMNYRERKKYAVDRVAQLHEEGRISNSVSDEFCALKKKDDAADCVLIAEWWRAQ
jgi:hypothetical protein